MADVTYIDRYFNAAFGRDTPVVVPIMSEKDLTNELMTFEINGRSENVLELASKEMRDLLSEYINHVNRTILNQIDSNQR